MSGSAFGALCMSLALTAIAEMSQSHLLDEIIAGCDANVAQIQHGSANYTVNVSTTIAGRVGTPEDETYSVRLFFDGPLCRWDIGDVRYVLDHDHYIDFDGRGLGDLENQDAYHWPAQIKHRNEAFREPWDFHPRTMGIGAWNAKPGAETGTIADAIRAVRKIPDVELVVEREGDLLRIVATRKSKNWKQEYWVDPSVGYGVVRRKFWSLKIPREPSSESETAYKLCEGAFIAQRQTRVERLYRAGDFRLERESRIETTLEELSLTDVPNPVLFTLDGMEIPKGARIRDKTTGKMYLYGINAATEVEIVRAMEQMTLDRFARDESSSWWRSLASRAAWVVAGIVVIVFVALLVRRYRAA